MLKLLLSTLVTFFLMPLSLAAEGRPEQVLLSFGDSRAAGTVIGSNGVCIVLSVKHFLDMPGRKVAVHSVGMAAPATPNAVIMNSPPGAQAEVDAALAQLSDPSWECPYSLADIRHDLWSQMLRDRMKSGGYDARLIVRLVAETELVDVPIRLAATPDSDTFDFFLDPKAEGRVPDRAGISGSGIYYDGQLVGLVTGASQTASDAYEAARIEVIVSALGLAESKEASDEEAPDRDDTPVAATGENLIPLFVTECDELAANPSDPARHPDVTGITFEKLDPVAAIKACERAEQDYPGSSRLIYQLGRAYGAAYLADPAAHEIGPALDKLNEALSVGHLVAINNLEKLLLRDHADCKGLEGCVERYRKSIKVLSHWNVDDARIREASFKVYGDLANKLCADPAKCLADLAAAYDAVSPATENYSNAQAQIAYLILEKGLGRHCPGDPQCLTFMQQSLSVHSAKGNGWTTNWLASLYSRYDAVPGVCADREACRKLAITTWQAAGEQGEHWGYYNLAKKAEDEGWQSDFGCQQPKDCSRLSFRYDERAYENGSQKSAGRLVWWLLFNQNAAGCFTQGECVARARKIMDSPGFQYTAWTKWLKAQALLDHPLAFEGFCAGDTCEAEAFRLFLESAEEGEALAMGRLADYYRLVGYDPERNPALTKAAGCLDELACASKSLEWSRKATEGGKGSWLDDWLGNIHEVIALENANSPETDDDTLRKRFQAALDPWLTAAEKLAAGSNVWSDVGFYRILRDFDSSNGSICGPIQQRCLSHLLAIKAFALQGSVTPEYISTFAGQLGCTTDCDPAEIKILARAAATHNSFAMGNLFDATGLDYPICPLETPTCPDEAATTLRKIIPDLTLAELEWAESVLENGEEGSHGTEDWDWLISQLAAKGSAMATGMQEVRYLESVFSDGLSYADIPENRAKQVVAGLADSLAPLDQVFNHAGSCFRATHLVFMLNHSALPVLSVAEEADLLLFYMMICGDQDRENGDTWLKGRSPKLRVELQQRLEVKADGAFGGGSWAAAESLQEAFRTSQIVPVGSVESEVVAVEPDAAFQTLETWPPAELLARSRAALLN